MFASVASASIQRRDYDTKTYFALHLHPSVNPTQIARQIGLTYEGQVGELGDHHSFSSPIHKSSQVDQVLDDLRRRRASRRKNEKRGISTATYTWHDSVLWSAKQIPRQRLSKRIPPPIRQAASDNQGAPTVQDGANSDSLKQMDDIASTLGIEDPTFKEQWHLFNPIQLGHDMNVTGVWLEGITGNGTISAVIDDGLDMYSDDLKDNYYAAGSWDFNDNTAEPKPRLTDDRHGTRCAGEIAAVRNNVCGVGMAYDSKVAGVRILSAAISDEDEAASLNYHFQENEIFSCSWGPPDDGTVMEAPGILVKKAMVNGIQKGRDGKGSVFVFAAGNGAASGDNCNFDGYTNSIYSITVGGIDRAGNHPYYSESCSANLVVTYSSGEGDAIHTTDVGTDRCYAGHGGTSAAGPLMVGAAALALSIRKDLTWRDVQYLVVNTAIPINIDTDGEWQDTKIGRKYSHMYGYGKLDTWAFVDAAKTWDLVKPQAWYHSPWLSVAHSIPQGDQGLASSFDVTADMLKNSNFERLEHVTVTMNVNHTRRGDLSVELRSPEGVVSHIATTRQKDTQRVGYIDWTFMSVAHWGESGIGTWTVIVKDTHVNDDNGTFVDWRLNLWGECINPTLQELHPMPDEHDDDHETATAPVHTTSVDPGTAPTLSAHPTDHPERPTKAKSSEGAEQTPTATTTSFPSASPSQPSPTTSTSPTPTPNDSFLPSFFPTFGLSKRTQIWLYAAVTLMILFCVALGIYFIIQRRKRRRNDPRAGYEFDVLPGDDDDDTGRGGANGHLRSKGKTPGGQGRRAGELYDAFAPGNDSDFEDEGFDELRDEDGDRRYRDDERGH